MRIWLFIACLALPVPYAFGQVEKLFPVDEGADDPSFFAFRARLLAALAARDTTFLMDHVAEDIRVSFGPANGIDAFRAAWKLAGPDSDLWPILHQTLAMGGTFEPAADTANAPLRFTAPYTFAAFPEHLDAFSHLVVIGEGVRVRDSPGREGRIMAALSFDVVALASDAADETPGWRRIVLADGTQGYISAAYVASPLDYRAGFERRDGVWKITYFVAGD